MQPKSEPNPRDACGSGAVLMTDEIPTVRPASYDKKVGLVLQGGGALGSYQAGTNAPNDVRFL
jgi:predicted acylesterase/phospholipase RssA